jgi:hypothetical protein
MAYLLTQQGGLLQLAFVLPLLCVLMCLAHKLARLLSQLWLGLDVTGGWLLPIVALSDQVRRGAPSA